MLLFANQTMAAVSAHQGVRTPILQLSAMQEGDYTFQLTVTDSSGQQDTAQVTVIVQPGKWFLLLFSFSSYHLGVDSWILCAFVCVAQSILATITLQHTLFKYTHK